MARRPPRILDDLILVRGRIQLELLSSARPQSAEAFANSAPESISPRVTSVRWSWLTVPSEKGHQWPANDPAADSNEVEVVVSPADVSQGRPVMARPYVHLLQDHRTVDAIRLDPGNQGVLRVSIGEDTLRRGSPALPNVRRTEPAPPRSLRSSTPHDRCPPRSLVSATHRLVLGRKIGIAGPLDARPRSGRTSPLACHVADQFALVPFER